jgi:hypothetical protein
MGTDCWPIFGRWAPGVGSKRVGLLCRIAVPGVTYEGVVVLRSVPQIFFGMSRLATLLLSLGRSRSGLPDHHNSATAAVITQQLGHISRAVFLVSKQRHLVFGTRERYVEEPSLLRVGHGFLGR